MEITFAIKWSYLYIYDYFISYLILDGAHEICYNIANSCKAIDSLKYQSYAKRCFAFDKNDSEGGRFFDFIYAQQHIRVRLCICRIHLRHDPIFQAA